MPFTHDMTVAAPAADVLAALTDEAFIRQALADLGVDVREVSTDGHRTVARFAVSTQGAPQIFARIVGDLVEMTDTRVWTAADGGAKGTVEVTTRVLGREARVAGRRRLEVTAEGSRLVSEGDVHVDAPLIARPAERALEEATLLVLRREEETLRRWLAR